MSAFSINIVGLSPKAHTFEFKLDKAFLDQFGRDLVPDGEFNARVVLDKHETFMKADFEIKGTARLTCDRSLDPFDFPIDVNRGILFKYGDEEKELSDEIVMISRDTTKLELGQLMYEFIGLEIPIKKLHPRFQEEDDDTDAEGKVIYSSKAEDNNDDAIDPRWEKLKKLK